MSDEEELEEYESECEYVYSICMPKLPIDLQPLECVVLIKGMMMSTGQPTITAMGSEGMSPWEAVGMLQMEAQRLVYGYSFNGNGTGFEDDEDDEEEDYE